MEVWEVEGVASILAYRRYVHARLVTLNDVEIIDISGLDRLKSRRPEDILASCQGRQPLLVIGGNSAPVSATVVHVHSSVWRLGARAKQFHGQIKKLDSR